MLPGVERHTSPEAVWDPLRPYLPEFLDHSGQSALATRTLRDLEGQARHFLVWMEQDHTRIADIDDAVLQRFRGHDCRCPRPRHGHYGAHIRRSRTLMSGVLRLVRFFEDTGRTRHPGEGDAGLRLLDKFLEQLAADGYSPVTLKHYRGVCRHLIAWLHQSRIAMKELGADIVNRFLHHDCLCMGFCRKHTGAAENRIAIERFAGFLAVQGVAPHACPASERICRAELPAFGDWLRRHRGIQESSIQVYVREVCALLPDLGSHPERYDATLIRDVLLHRFGQVSRVHTGRVTISMRMYLRFLASSGACPPELVGAVPAVPRWRLATLPRYISAEDIERVIASCDTATPAGIRDRAVLLLARLALRAGDVTGLKLDDIDWESARIRVCGKSRRSVGLPLPQDAGDAVLTYIEQARPRVDERTLFLRVMAPHRALSSSRVISGIVDRALKRAGIDNATPRGAHLLRHSAATAMLRDGASLEAIGTLLRHRSPDTTAIYAKVSHPMLQEVSQAWIGGSQ